MRHCGVLVFGTPVLEMELAIDPSVVSILSLQGIFGSCLLCEPTPFSQIHMSKELTALARNTFWRCSGSTRKIQYKHHLNSRRTSALQTSGYKQSSLLTAVEQRRGRCIVSNMACQQGIQAAFAPSRTGLLVRVRTVRRSRRNGAIRNPSPIKCAGRSECRRSARHVKKSERDAVLSYRRVRTINVVYRRARSRRPRT